MPSLLINCSHEYPGRAPLTHPQVWAIREAIADRLADGPAAARAGVSKEDVNDVRQGRYDHVPPSRWDRRLISRVHTRLPRWISWH